MARKYKFCIECRRTIVEDEFRRGLYVQTPQGMLCATCAQRLDEETEAAKAAKASAPEPAAVEPPAPAVEEKLKPVPASPPPSVPPEPPQEAALKEVGVPLSVTRVPAPQKAAVKAPAEPSPTEPLARPDPSAQQLEEIREHVEAIRRTLFFEKSSPWNVMATIAQCLAIGMLVIAAFNWADKPDNLLLVALIFQVMALTFFVRGK